jgi:hypothetical protein
VLSPDCNAKAATQPVTPSRRWPPDFTYLKSRIPAKDALQNASTVVQRKISFSKNLDRKHHSADSTQTKHSVNIVNLPVVGDNETPLPAMRAEYYLNAKKKLKKAVLEHYRYVSFSSFRLNVQNVFRGLTGDLTLINLNICVKFSNPSY